MTDREGPPSSAKLAAFLGAPAHRRWRMLLARIDRDYAGVFAPDWIYGGEKYGWGLRFKKSTSFCTLIPEAKGLSVQIVFGRAERVKMESAKSGLRKATCEAYEAATVFHDGKWLFLPIDCDGTVEEVFRMLAAKRGPRSATNSDPR